MERKEIQLGGRAESHHLTFEEAIKDGITAALANISQRFEHAENPLDNLAFHNTQHTKSVIERTKKILEAMGVNKGLVMLGEFIAAHHDTVQDYSVSEKDGKKMRARFIEKNEEASIEEAVVYMRANPSVFDEEDIEIVREAIQATIPRYDVEKKTIKQPHLLESVEAAMMRQRLMTDKSELVTRAIALADLGTAGMDDSESFVHDGNAIFQEENIDITEALQHPKSLSNAQKESFQKRMLDWTANQIFFAKGREALFDKELEGLPEKMERNVRALFTEFGSNIQRAQAKADIRKTMSFEDLVRDFGYKT